MLSPSANMFHDIAQEPQNLPEASSMTGDPEYVDKTFEGFENLEDLNAIA